MPYIQTITPPEPAPKFNASYERLDLNESKPAHEAKLLGSPSALPCSERTKPSEGWVPRAERIG